MENQSIIFRHGCLIKYFYRGDRPVLERPRRWSIGGAAGLMVFEDIILLLLMSITESGSTQHESNLLFFCCRNSEMILRNHGF